MKFNRRLVLPLVALVVVAIVLTAVTAALLTVQTEFSATGTIEPTPSSAPTTSPQPVTSINVDIYVDAAATTPLTSLSWGTLNPGAVVTRTIYVKNSGNTAETLNMTATQWNPAAASSVLTLTWNKEASVLDAGAVVPATLTLKVAADPGAVTSFSMNIVITGTA